MESFQKYKLVLPIIIICLLIMGCINEKPNSILTIDVEKAMQSTDEINCSDFISGFEYVKLETNSNCLIGERPTVHLLSDNIIIQTNLECLIFERNTGKFKYKIGRRGKGPGEYNKTMRLVNPIDETIFLRGWGNEILEFSETNELLRSHHLPNYDNSFTTPSMPTVFTIHKNCLICYFSNITGKEQKLIMALNLDSNQLEFIVPNTHITDNKRLSISTGEAWFNSYNDNFLFKEIYNDTVYELKNEQLFPHMILNTGKFLFSYQMNGEGGFSQTEYITILNFFESDVIVCFQYLINRKLYFGLYSKESRNLIVSDMERGLINNIDGFVNFKPIFNLNDKNIVGIVDAYDIVNWFSGNTEKMGNLSPNLKELENVKENDNPIIMIATFEK